MKTVYKYELNIADTQDVEMPEGAEILTVQTQRDMLCLWAFVDTDAPAKSRTIEIVGTGNPADSGERKYISTVQVRGGMLVWHIFERIQ